MLNGDGKLIDKVYSLHDLQYWHQRNREPRRQLRPHQGGAGGVGESGRDHRQGARRQREADRRHRQDPRRRIRQGGLRRFHEARADAHWRSAARRPRPRIGSTSTSTVLRLRQRPSARRLLRSGRRQADVASGSSVRSPTSSIPTILRHHLLPCPGTLRAGEGPARQARGRARQDRHAEIARTQRDHEHEKTIALQPTIKASVVTPMRLRAIPTQEGRLRTAMRCRPDAIQQHDLSPHADLNPENRHA